MSRTYISIDESDENISLEFRVSIDTEVVSAKKLETMFNNVAYKFKQFLIMLNYTNE